MRVAVFQIYNDSIQDLLADESAPHSNSNSKSVNWAAALAGKEEVHRPAAGAAAAMALIERGAASRTVGRCPNLACAEGREWRGGDAD